MPGADKLVEGYKRFREGYYKENKALLYELAEQGQFPKIALVSCCDSRVEPTIIMDCNPGDLFVIRNVANLVPPCEDSDNYHGTSAALEFAVTGLEVECIIVLGHTQCGGIKALMDSPQIPTAKTFISTWMKQLSEVKNSILENEDFTSPEHRYHACEKQGIEQSIRNLMTFPWVRSRVESGNLKLHGWYYDLNSAELFGLESEEGVFVKIT
jgi:carbonic anhydrase